MTVRSVTLRQNPAYRPGISLLPPACAVAWGLLLACAPPVPRQQVSPAVTFPEQAVPLSSWKPTRDLLARDYTIEHRALLTIGMPGAETRDSAVIRVDASLRRTADGGFGGVISAIAIGGTGNAGQAAAGLSFPFAVAAPPATLQPLPAFVAGLPAAAASCPSPVPAALNALHDLTIPLPDSLYVGASWTDSVGTVACAGDIEIPMAAGRIYTVMRHADAGSVDSLPLDHVAIRRTSRVTINTNVFRDGDTTFVLGQGTSAITFLVATQTGDVLAGYGTANLQITARSATQQEQAAQASTVRLWQRRR